MPLEPEATYRLQLHAGFGFDRAAELADYLRDLGISHLYSSPLLQAVPGSMHGYDVLDPTRVNAELGGAMGFKLLHASLMDAGLGLLLDIVPNHMAIGMTGNPWWWDVLENGPASRYASYFAVDWETVESREEGRILLPVLGDHYGRVLEAGGIVLERDGGTFTLRVGDLRFPVSPRTLDNLLGGAALRAGSQLLAFIADSHGLLPASYEKDTMVRARRHRNKEVLRSLLTQLCDREPGVVAALDEAVREHNVDHDAMDGLLARQNYRLAFWRAAGQALGYRRFFDINDLIALNQENQQVFEDTHRLIAAWIAEGWVDGVRVDHVDGLRDPGGYLERLRRIAPECRIFVEKILEPGERLPGTWPVAGTTGYDFLNTVAGLFVDPAGEAPLTALYASFTGEEVDYATVVREKKLQVLSQVLGSDVFRLTDLLRVVCDRHRRYRDYTRSQLAAAIRAMIACLPVYRTYVRPEPLQVSASDVVYVALTADAVKEYDAGIDPDLVDFLRDILLLRVEGYFAEEFAVRFQQVTGPAMAKGVEDTAFYCYNRFVALNEVGGDPGRFGISPEAFHADSEEALERWPLRMIATATHDTKRGEDLRARLALLSEMPDVWGAAVARWRALNERHRTGGDPDRNDEYLLYQTLVGAWPAGEERITAYMEKAAREAKRRTSWLKPDAGYEKALLQFVRAVLDDEAFLGDLRGFVEPLVRPGYVNALSQVLLKITAPGVPDFYQGTELWDFSLVDPDNRRPVDYALRRRYLVEAAGMSAGEAMARLHEGLPKIWLIRRALAFRQDHRELFGPDGRYEPLRARGHRSDHVVAFMRGGAAMTVAPRLVLGLGDDWGDTTLELPPGRWRNALTGAGVAGGARELTELLREFPVALLGREG